MKSENYFAKPKYNSTIIPSAMRYHPKITKLCFLINAIRKRTIKMDTAKDTKVPIMRIRNSIPVKCNPNFRTFRRLAPNITGIAR